MKANDVSKKFVEFLKAYDEFRKMHHLSGSIDNIFEVTTAMTDKHGRICRQVKHLERNDPKPDWETAIPEALTGYLVYASMIAKRYGINIEEGMMNELNASIDQHSFLGQQKDKENEDT